MNNQEKINATLRVQAITIRDLKNDVTKLKRENHLLKEDLSGVVNLYGTLLQKEVERVGEMRCQ